MRPVPTASRPRRRAGPTAAATAALFAALTAAAATVGVQSCAAPVPQAQDPRDVAAAPTPAPVPGGWTASADLVLHSGSIVTMDEQFTIARALAVKDGRIISVGADRAALAHVGPGTRVIDLGGRTVLPGLIDSHIHFVGLGRDITEEADLTFAMSAGDILVRISELMRRRPPAPDAWVIGNRWDQYKYPEMVTRWDLDSIAPRNPVLLNRVYRGVAVNTRVLERMGIFDDLPHTWPSWWLEDPPDFTFEDRILRAPRELLLDGRREIHEVPTGVFLGVRAVRLVTERPPAADFEDDVASIRGGVAEMLSLGVTSIVDPSTWGGHVMRVYQEAYNRGWLDLRVGAVYEGTFTTQHPDSLRSHFRRLLVNNLGDRTLRFRGAKFYSDGGAGTRSAWVSVTFAHWRQFEGMENRGYPVMADHAVRREQYRAAVDNGWDLHTHAAGDVSMRQAVDLYRELMGEVRRRRPDADLRWSLIHAYLPIEEGTRVVDEMAELGIIAASNPVFQWQEGAAFATNLGPARMARTQPFRSYVDAGVVVASGSDYPVTTHDPWIGLYALLTRRDQASGRVYGPEETLGIVEALKTYTTNGAYLTYDEGWKGSLEPGKVADLVILDLSDIHELERDPELCLGMRERVLLTMVEGEIRYRAEGAPF